MSRRRRPGAGRAAVALTALAFFGAGCTTPRDEGVLAVEQVEDGGVRLLLARCPGYLAQDFSVIADTPDDEPAGWSVHNGSWTASVADVRVFQDPPEGWRNSSGELTALRKGVPYVANVDGTIGGRDLRGRVPFTVEDLAGLKSGDVLTWSGGEKNVTVARDAFLRADPARCRP